MAGNRFIVVAVLLLVLNGLACSVGGEIDMGGPTPTPETVERETAAPTEPLAETPAPPTDAPPSPEPETPSETRTPQPVEPQATEEPIPTAPPPPPPTEAPVEQEPLAVAEIPELETTTLDPQGQGLGNLGAFRQHMKLSFTAETGGYTGFYNYDAEVNTGDQAIHVTISAEGEAALQLPANSLQAIWIGDRAWFKLGNQPWLPYPESVQALPFDQQVFAVGSFLPYVSYFQRVDEREINGIPCAYYTYDAQDLPTQYGAVSGQGDICVAITGGYVVHYTLDGSGAFDEYFQGDGTLSLVYDTYDVGADILITPPRR